MPKIIDGEISVLDRYRMLAALPKLLEKKEYLFSSLPPAVLLATLRHYKIPFHMEKFSETSFVIYLGE